MKVHLFFVCLFFVVVFFFTFFKILKHRKYYYEGQSESSDNGLGTRKQ